MHDPASISLVFIERGDVSIVPVSDHEATASAKFQSGDAFLARPPFSNSIIVESGANLLTILAPATILGETAPNSGSMLSLQPGSPLAAPTRAFAREALEAKNDVSSFNHYFFARLLEEMFIGIVVDAIRAARRPHAGTDAFTAALGIITAQCTDSELTADGIARDVNLSLRQLERVFRERGTTIGKQIRLARVDHAVSLLQSDDFRTLNIDQIARFAGFSNGSSLARAMQAEGRATPLRVRAAARPA